MTNVSLNSQNFRARNVPEAGTDNMADASVVEEKDLVESSVEWKIDTDALTGLRGLVALHIALGHILNNSRVGIDLQGGMSMSFFYLLSGFIMSIAYGSKATKGETTGTIEIDVAASKENSFTIEKWKFWKNRFARLYPMYLLTNLTAIPMALEFNRFSISNVLVTMSGMNMWVYPFAPTFFLMPLNGGTWTIQTMLFFYLVFPALFPFLLGITDRFKMIRSMYWTQLFFFFAPFLIYIPIYGELKGAEYSYWVARAWPVSRLPVFIMGCLAAIERVKRKGDQWSKKIKPAALSACCCCGSKQINDSDPSEEKYWKRRRICDTSACSYMILLIAVIFSVFLIKIRAIGEMKQLPLKIKAIGEAITPLLFLRLLLSLTETSDERKQGIMTTSNDKQDKKRSVFESICRSKAAIFLGNISLGFYLIHMQVVMLTKGLFNYNEYWPPIWIIPINIFVSIILGYVVTYMVEKPMQRFLRR
mmetsp:Transcript_26993/g.53922  ORF Transcript_26993/g.53922 Transcript_26993/m.53922 type:complete len:476 (+) Transcript_26993:220-1647(+)